jgi:molybdopterin-guanine dinucleotide biosynthesis protein
VAGALAVGILSPSMTAMYLPVTKELVGSTDRYAIFSHVFSNCRLILVEGDSQTQAAKIEVWRKDLGTPPLAWQDQGILAVVTDDPISVDADVLPRANVSAVVDWIARNLLAP